MVILLVGFVLAGVAVSFVVTNRAKRDGASEATGGLSPRPRMIGMRGIVRRWWPPVVLLAVVVAVQVVWMNSYEVTGHAAGHLQSSTGIFFGVFIGGVTLWAIPATWRSHPLVLLVLVGLLTGYLLIAYGNLEVVEAIGGRNWTDEQAAARGSSVPAFVRGHELAGLGMWLTVAAALFAAFVLWRLDLVSGAAAGGSAAMSLLVPAWILPGAGLLVLGVAACLGRARSHRAEGAGPLTATAGRHERGAW